MVYIPADPPEAVVFAGHGQVISQWGGVLEAAGVPPTMIVGVHRLADETLRLHEYSPGFDPGRFAAHEEFLVVVPTRIGVSPEERQLRHGCRACAPAPTTGAARARRFGCSCRMGAKDQVICGIFEIQKYMARYH